MSTTGRNAFVQTFAKVVDSFVNRCLRQVIPDLLQCTFQAPHFTLVKEALIEIGCVVTSLVGWSLVGRWLSRACTVAKRCILGL